MSRGGHYHDRTIQITDVERVTITDGVIGITKKIYRNRLTLKCLSIPTLKLQEQFAEPHLCSLRNVSRTPFLPKTLRNSFFCLESCNQ